MNMLEMAEEKRGKFDFSEKNLARTIVISYNILGIRKRGIA